jgi:putative hydrolase of the HAD superfamily
MADTTVVLWDVYGTLIATRGGDLQSLLAREKELRAAFEQTVKNFGLNVPAPTLHERFIGGIAAERETKIAGGVRHPEVRIEEIWYKILEDLPAQQPVTPNGAREVALFFERVANPRRLQPNAFETLTALHRRGLRQGIISNAQFYTPIELSELLREESDCAICTYESIFDRQLVFFSFELGVAKPDPTAFQRARDVLARDGIKPSQCLVVGDSAENDIEPARQVGFRAVRFAPDGDIQRLPQIFERL